MNSHFREKNAASDTWLEQLQNELVLAQYEAQKWKEKYFVEKRRRQKAARDLLDLVMRTDEGKDVSTGKVVDRVASNRDHTATLLSPTLSSFDFDDDSSEDESEESNDQSLEASSNLNESAVVNETRVENTEVSSSQSDGDEPFNSSLAWKVHDRQSLMFQTKSTAGILGRGSRSSTTGSSLEAFSRSSRPHIDGKNEHVKHKHLMYRIMYATPSSCDSWHARIHPHKLQNVAHSIMYSMHMKKEHIFERFFVTGMTPSNTEQPARFAKPRLLYDFPNRISDTPDESVVDFCFPRGVPLITCNSEQAKSVQGVAVSKWYTDIDSIQKQAKEAPETSGYTFRLTGAKGEVLYGYCVALLREVTPEYSSETSLTSKKLLDQVDDSSVPLSSRENDLNRPCQMAPMCYCFTSKFPFYRLYFTLLRMIVENELFTASIGDSTKKVEHAEQYEIVLRPSLDLAVEFTIYHEENVGLRDQYTDLNKQSSMNSIATKLDVSPVDRRAVLSEDVTTTIEDNESSTETRRLPSQLRKSFSTDDIDNCDPVNGWIIDKPMVKSISSSQPKEYDCVNVGDILESIDSIATASMSYKQTQTLLVKGLRPMRLRFRRSTPKAQTSPTASRRPKWPCVVSSTSVDILYRARRIKINDPGHWSSTRFPAFDLSYQFPKRHSDRWSVGVVLRYSSPDKVVEIMANLLLEKQIVIMSESPAKVSAVCTALLLLLSPFQWQSTYIPLLPSSLLDFLHSPVPFLVGCHSLDDTSEWADVCFYDIDKDRIVVPARTRHWGPKSIPNGIELYRLLRKARERFCALRPTNKPWYELSAEQDTIITLTTQEAEIFLRDLGFNISSQDLAASISGGQSFYDRLREEVAKEVRNSVYEDYLDEFTQTQLFCEYYESLLQPEVQTAQE